MELPTYFSDFLQTIRTTKEQLAEMHKEQTLLRQRLAEDKNLGPLIVSTFLHGSQRRATAHRPPPKKKADADVIAVTKIDKDRVTAKEALKMFRPFLEKYYPGKYEPQGRSYAILFNEVKVDLVPTSAPSEVEIPILTSKAATALDSPDEAGDWKLAGSWVPQGERALLSGTKFLKKLAAEEEWKPSPLWIPDRDADQWQPTHPLKQMQWTWAKNSRCYGHFVNVIRAGKWWRCVCRPTPKYPKSYPLENLMGLCCPDGITSVATGFTIALSTVAERYAAHAARNATPFVPDHGIPENNVLARVSGTDFALFHRHVVEAAEIARRALDAKTVKESADTWRELFGEAFPVPPEEPPVHKSNDNPQGGYTPRKDVSVIGGGRFA